MEDDLHEFSLSAGMFNRPGWLVFDGVHVDFFLLFKGTKML